MNDTLVKYNQGPLNQQQKQQQQKQQWEKLVDLVHYNEQNQTYKTLSVLRTDSGNIVMQTRDGQKGGGSSQIIFQLNEQELAYLAVKLQKLL